MKYPLTDGAKAAARFLTEQWRQNRIEQAIVVDTFRLGDRPQINFGASEPVDCPSIAVLWELARFGLTDIQPLPINSGQRWRILLLQELLNAVDSDFEVSDYFLTMNAVGMIVHGDVNVEAGAMLQSAATNFGNITQTNELADRLTTTFSEQFLQEHADLTAAIDALRQSNKADRQSKVGKVISELGRCLGHTSNTASVITAILGLAQFLQGVM